MKNQTIKFYKVIQDGLNEKYELNRVIPALIYKTRMLIKPEGGIDEIAVHLIAKINRSTDITGSLLIEYNGEWYRITEIRDLQLVRSSLLYLTKLARTVHENI